MGWSYEKADRFNEGKLKWSLVDFKSLEEMVRVLEYGAKKYTKIFVPLLEEKVKEWNVNVVKETEISGLEECAIVVMKPNCLTLIQIENKGKPITSNSIEKIISKSLKKLTGLEIRKDQLTRFISKKSKMLIISEDMELLTTNSKDLKILVANFVEKSSPRCTLTTTIPLENSEVSYVVSATTDLASLMMTLNCLEGVLNTSISMEGLIDSGKHNWKKGLDKEETAESLMRHLFSLLNGEELDKESGLPHTGHILCNAMFLSYICSHNADVQDLQNKIQTSLQHHPDGVFVRMRDSIFKKMHKKAKG